MRALILAAGRGSRLGALTDERPKGLVEVCGRSLIAWQLEALRSAGVEEVAIVRGYLGHAFPFETTYFENPRWAETSIVASLACAEAWLAAGPTLVSYADIVYSPDAVRRLRYAPGDVAIAYDTRWLALWRQRFEDPLSDAETFRVDAAGVLQEIGRRPASLEEVRGQYMGLLKLTPRGAGKLLARFRALDAHDADRLDVTALLDLLVGEGEGIRTVPFDGWWCEVDSSSDLRVAEEILERRPPA